MLLSGLKHPVTCVDLRLEAPPKRLRAWTRVFTLRGLRVSFPSYFFTRRRGVRGGTDYEMINFGSATLKEGLQRTVNNLSASESPTLPVNRTEA